MSQLNLFHRFTAQEEYRSHLTLNPKFSALLDYLEYSIHGQFNERDKEKYKKKNRKKQLGEQFVSAIKSLSRQQRADYYIRIIGYLRNFVKENYDPPISPYSGELNDIGYSRSYNVKKWKEKKLKFDQNRHIIFAERQDKIKTYDLKNYLLRLSKNKQYSCFVLQAINNNPPEKSRTVHLGFTNKNVFEKWYKSIKFSVQFREWQIYRFLYCGNLQKIEKIERVSNPNPNSSFISQGIKQTLSIMEQSKVLDTSYDYPLTQSAIIPLTQNKGELNKSISQQYVPQFFKKQQQQKQINVLQNEIKMFEQKRQNAGNYRKTLLDDLIDGDVFQQPDVFEDKIQEQDQKSKENKRHLDLFHKLYPEYELQELEIYFNFNIIHEEQNIKIFQNQILQKRLKMVVTFNKQKHNIQQILSMISKGENFKSLNENVQQIQVKTNIPSQNSALMYMVLKPFNRLYRSRDFIFIRHVFKSGNQLYMVDKSIENTNYPPFMTIVRGQLCIVYGIFDRDKNYQLIIDAQITNQGLLNISQETNLTLKFLKAFNKLPQAQSESNSYKFFDLDWDITKNQANKIENQIRQRRNTLNQMNKKHEKVEVNIQQQHQKAFKKKKQKTENGLQNEQKTIKKIDREKDFSPSPNNSSKSSSLSPQSNHKAHQKKSQNQKKIEQNRSKQVKQVKQDKQLKEVKQVKDVKETKQIKQVKQVKRQQKQSKKQHKVDKQIQQYSQVAIQQSNKKIVQFKTNESVARQLDQEGMVIIDKSYIKHHFILKPIQKQKTSLKYLTSPVGGHPIWNNQWIHDDKQGSIIFVHKKKIQDQKGVLKFILSKMAKNLVSGQSVLSISLPVDIFSAQSNLQRFLYSMAYGPLILEGIEKQTPIHKLINTVIFGITNSVLYLNMQKPFNPILGQTFQCWINGCPAYAEQISHHPPIAALIFKGRGYEITAQLQSKVSLGVNSGTGCNDGIYHVSFADKTQVCFIVPGGQVSGLSHGDRKFNLVGKSYYWIANTNIMLQIAFDPFKKGFFSVGKQQKPSDYFQGTIYEVRPEFMTKFLNGKYKQPQEKDRIRSYGVMSGVWNKYIKYNNQQIFNLDKQYPLILEYQPNPLPSDANWRQDIEYRRRNQITKAQTQKQRLQNLQRKDRKLRQKFQKKKK